MNARVLVGADPCRIGPGPINLGLAAARLCGARLVIASVQAEERTTCATGLVHEDLLIDCGPAIEQIEAAARAWSVPVECVRLQGTSAARALYDEAARTPTALLVVGEGRTARLLLQGAPCPIAVTSRSWISQGAPESIGVGFVDTEEGHAALRAAAGLARRIGASLRALHVVPNDIDPSTQRRAEQALAAAADELVGGGPFDVDILAGDPADRLVFASADVDLLVCGARGYGPQHAVLLGSVTRRVTLTAQCPVLVLPRGLPSLLDPLLAQEPHAAAT